MLIVFILQMLVLQALNGDVETIDHYLILLIILSEIFVDLHYLGKLFSQIFVELLIIALKSILADLFHKFSQGVFLFSDVLHLSFKLLDQRLILI